MGGRVVQTLRLIVGAGYDPVVAYDNGSDGNFSLIGGCTGFYQRLLHEIFVVEWVDHLLISFSLKRVG